MDFLNNLKLDAWWKMVLLLGLLSIAASLLFNPVFLESKHLFGLGIGFLCIGISYWIAEKSYSTIKPPNAYTGPAAHISWTAIHHNFATGIILAAGIIIAIIFGYLIIKGLL